MRLSPLRGVLPRLPRYLPVSRPCSSFISYRQLSSSAQSEDEFTRKWTTPLAEQLARAVEITGPIPLATYMRMCLTSDLGGYYTGAIGEGRDQFGVKGDFITSPEISQVFGELIGVWFVAEWMSQGKPSRGVELIEVGPGRGTLMDDMLRTIQKFPDMAKSIDAIYMVEASPKLREAQKNLLCGPDSPTTESKVGYHSICKYTNLPIVWTETIQSIPKEASKMPFIVAHEFFDALPIHAFQAVEIPPPPTDVNPDAPSDATPPPSKPDIQWREMVVTPTPPDSTHATLKTPESERHGATPEFQLTLSKDPTRHSKFLPDSSLRFRNLKSVPDAVIEICPEASLYAADFSARIGGSRQHPKQRPSGAALILDYGTTSTVPINSLRGIRHHRRVSPFSEPGLVDISADVDFTAIAESAIRSSEGVEAHGPVDQADFLLRMGIEQRAEMLTRTSGTDAEQAKKIEGAWKRLVDRGPGGMGKVYKVLALLPENDGKRQPVGFGGDLS